MFFYVYCIILILYLCLLFTYIVLTNLNISKFNNKVFKRYTNIFKNNNKIKVKLINVNSYLTFKTNLNYISNKVFCYNNLRLVNFNFFYIS